MGWRRLDQTCLLLVVILVALLVGCGTTKWSDTARTATEQLLISDAIDRVVSSYELRALAGKQVYLETSHLKGVTDAEYLIGSIRQHALASGCILMSELEDADYILEIRVGALGTDRHDVMLGIPATTVPTGLFTAGPANAQVPELALAKKTDQRAVAKIGLFAYNRHSGRPVWQSGTVPGESSAKAVWVFGAGPFRRGKIFDGTRFGGDKLSIPLISPGEQNQPNLGEVSVAAEAYFAEPPAEVARRIRDSGVSAVRSQPNRGSSSPDKRETPSPTGPQAVVPASAAGVGHGSSDGLGGNVRVGATTDQTMSKGPAEFKVPGFQVPQWGP